MELAWLNWGSTSRLRFTFITFITFITIITFITFITFITIFLRKLWTVLMGIRCRFYFQILFGFKSYQSRNNILCEKLQRMSLIPGQFCVTCSMQTSSKKLQKKVTTYVPNSRAVNSSTLSVLRQKFLKIKF